MRNTTQSQNIVVLLHVHPKKYNHAAATTTPLVTPEKVMVKNDCKPILVKFMLFAVNDVNYNNDYKFSQDELAAVKPIDVRMRLL